MYTKTGIGNCGYQSQLNIVNILTNARDRIAINIRITNQSLIYRYIKDQPDINTTVTINQLLIYRYIKDQPDINATVTIKRLLIHHTNQLLAPVIIKPLLIYQ